MPAARWRRYFCDFQTTVLGIYEDIRVAVELLYANGMKEPSAKRQRTLALHDRALRFSVDVNACCPNSFSNVPSRVVWEQLVRAADGASNNLIEADDATTDADFLSKMSIALREAKESRAALLKLRMGHPFNFNFNFNFQLQLPTPNSTVNRQLPTANFCPSPPRLPEFDTHGILPMR